MKPFSALPIAGRFRHDSVICHDGSMCEIFIGDPSQRIRPIQGLKKAFDIQSIHDVSCPTMVVHYRRLIVKLHIEFMTKVAVHASNPLGTFEKVQKGCLSRFHVACFHPSITTSQNQGLRILLGRNLVRHEIGFEILHDYVGVIINFEKPIIFIPIMPPNVMESFVKFVP